MVVVTRSVDAEDDDVGASVVVVVVVTVRLADVSGVGHTPVAGMSVALRLVPCTAVVNEFEDEDVEDVAVEEGVEEAVAAGWCWALRNTSCSCCVRR